MKWLIQIILFLLAMSAMAQKEEPSKTEWQYRLMVEQETGFDFGTNNLQKSEWVLDPEVGVRFGKNLKFFGQLRVYTELADELEPGRADFSNYSRASRPLHLGDRAQLELRELYMDLGIGKSYWRIGKQQVVWGETDGFKVLDRLNPMSFREFILDDFDDSRIPLWALKGDVKLGKMKITIFWSPDLTSHQLPSAEGSFYPSADMRQPPAGVEVRVEKLEIPDQLIQDSDVGLQLATQWGGWEMAMNYIYQYGKKPVLRKSLDANTGVLTVTPIQVREHVIGGSFGNTMGSFGLRGEVAYFPTKQLPSTNASTNGLSGTNQLMSGLALDYFGISDGILTVQWFGDFLTESRSEKLFQRDRMTHTITVMHTQFLMNQLLEIEAFGGYRLVEKGMVFDLKTTYSLKDNLKVWLGADLFIANNPGLLAPFNNRDRIMVGFEWGIQ